MKKEVADRRRWEQDRKKEKKRKKMLRFGGLVVD